MFSLSLPLVGLVLGCFPVYVLGQCDDTYYIADNLDVQYIVINNLLNDSHTSVYEGQFVLTNKGDQDISSNGLWTIYFCNIRVLEPSRLKPGLAPIPEGVLLGDSGIRVRHVQSCLFRLDPTPDFQTLEPEGSMAVPFQAMWWHVATTDIMPNWYVTHTSCNDPKTIVSTAGEELAFVGPFDDVSKWKRDMADQYNPYSLDERFWVYDIEDLGEAPLGVLPTPVHQQLNGANRLKLDSADWVVMFETPDVEEEARFLADKLGMDARPADDNIKYRYIMVKIDPSMDSHQECRDNMEEYHLIIRGTQIVEVIAGTPSGVFNGIQSLLALAEDPQGVPTGEIRDCPRFLWRGVHIDVSRNFFGLESLQRLLDGMATYKLNILHLHLADDEGWRLEIPGLEELTQVGSTRCHTTTGDDCIIPMLGSGPYPSSLGSGYLSVAQYRQLLEFARVRHITVIPEFDMPGHSHAAIKAMEARYRKYKDIDISKAEEFLLTDFNDTSDYFSAQLFTDNAINPCIESTYRFVEHVVNQTMQIHAGVQDLEIFHFGGDEVPETSWLNSSACWDLWEEFPELNRTKAMKIYFVSRAANITSNLGLDLAGWEDGFTNEGEFPFDRTFFPNNEVYSHVWNNRWELGAGRHAYDHANAGYKVILSHGTHLYFDHPHEPDPSERGYYWATRFTDTFKTFSYLADHIYDNLDVDRLGNPLDREEVCKEHGCPDLEEPQNIIGLQGQLWTETTRTAENFDSMLFPRLLALAERAWHRASWEDEADEEERRKMIREDWTNFANAVGYRELARLDNLGIRYHIRPPGIRNPDTDFILRANSVFPGQPVVISSDGGATWRDFITGESATEGTTYTLAVRSADRRRTSRHSEVEYPETSRASVHDVISVTLLTAALISAVLSSP